MIPLLAETSVKVLGKQVTDPKLQLLSFVAFVLFFVGIGGLAITSRMVDEARIRAEANIAQLFGRGLPPRRILTDIGRKIQASAVVALVLGIIAFIGIASAS